MKTGGVFMVGMVTIIFPAVREMITYLVKKVMIPSMVVVATIISMVVMVTMSSMEKQEMTNSTVMPAAIP